MPLCRIYRRLVLHSARDRVRGGSLNALVDFIETISTPGLYPPTSHNSSICPVCGCVSQFDCESFSFFYILSPSRLYSIVFEFFDCFLLERIWCELTRRSLLTRFFPPHCYVRLDMEQSLGYFFYPLVCSCFRLWMKYAGPIAWPFVNLVSTRLVIYLPTEFALET